MGTFKLDELECDEIHAALIERRATLDTRKKKLLEEGLPEAAEGIDKRRRLYDSHDGPDNKPRTGLVRLFAPQRDVEAEIEQSRRGQDRNAEGQQDIFGGGAATGGAPRGGSASVSNAAPGDNAGGEIIDVDFEVIPEGRRIAASSTLTIESALSILAQIARVLLAGPEHVEEADYLNFANAVVAVIPAMNPQVDAEHIRAHVLEELAAADDNAHGLAHYVNRMADQIRDLRDNPPTPKGVREFVEATEAELSEMKADERAEYDAEKAEHAATVAAANGVEPGNTPIADAAAAALRAVVFPEGAEPAAEGLTFETPNGTGETKPPAGETNEAADANTKGAKKKRGRKPKGQK